MFSGISFNFLDAIDILLVTLLIYYVIMFIRGTRVIAALNGLFLLLVIYAFSVVLGLNTIVWLFENVFSSLLLIIVILFHDDIRNALSSFTVKSIFLKRSNYEGDIVNKLSTTCFALSKRKVGALIVLERQVKLGDIAQSGVKLDAVVTPELLITIFEPKTPLHDGAVIINTQGMIEVAAAILPLAETDNQEFGTRHRAALGISNISDAVVIVVSEERGAVTIASNGTITAPLSQEEFERRLSNVISK